MSPIHRPSLQYEPPTTTGVPVFTSGVILPDTHQVRQYVLFASNRLPTSDSLESFTEKELTEIIKSMIDIRLGNFKTFRSSEELFADLDQ